MPYTFRRLQSFRAILLIVTCLSGCDDPKVLVREVQSEGRARYIHQSTGLVFYQIEPGECGVAKSFFVAPDIASDAYQRILGDDAVTPKGLISIASLERFNQKTGFSFCGQEEDTCAMEVLERPDIRPFTPCIFATDKFEIQF